MDNKQRIQKVIKRINAESSAGLKLDFFEGDQAIISQNERGFWTGDSDDCLTALILFERGIDFGRNNK